MQRASRSGSSEQAQVAATTPTPAGPGNRFPISEPLDTKDSKPVPVMRTGKSGENGCCRWTMDVRNCWNRLSSFPRGLILRPLVCRDRTDLPLFTMMTTFIMGDHGYGMVKASTMV